MGGGILRGWHMGYYHLSRNRDDDDDNGTEVKDDDFHDSNNNNNNNNNNYYYEEEDNDDDLDRVYRETYTTSDVTNQQYNNEGIYIHGFCECNAITLKLGDKTNGTQCRFSQRQQRIGSIMTTKKDGKKEKRRSRMMMMKKVKTVVDGPTLTFAFPNYSNNSHNGNDNNNNNNNNNNNTNTNTNNDNNNDTDNNSNKTQRPPPAPPPLLWRVQFPPEPYKKALLNTFGKALC